MPPQIQRIGASHRLSGPLAKRSTVLTLPRWPAPPCLAVRMMATQLGTSGHAMLNELQLGYQYVNTV
eukprot:825186-Pleurochrysis_carterae.AAC.1